LQQAVGSTILDSFPEMVDTLPEFRIATVGHPLPQELSDQQLVTAVAHAGGQVMIGLKAAASPGSRVTGVVPGISRSTALGARSAIEAAGASIIRTYRYLAMVAAVIPPELAPRLRALPFVDFIEPVGGGRLMADDSTFGIGKQDTTWGVKQVDAPGVWNGQWGTSTRGEGIYVNVLDNGIDEVHRFYADGPANVNLDCYYLIGDSCYGDVGDSLARNHGEFVAGLISSINDDRGGIGVAWNVAGTASLRVCTWTYRDNAWIEYCPDYIVASGLDWVLEQHGSRPRQIVNMSIGWCTDFQSIREALVSLELNNILVVAAAGNTPLAGSTEDKVCSGDIDNLPSGSWSTAVMYPAAYDWLGVLAVAGTVQGDTFAWAPSGEEGGGPLPGNSGGNGAGSLIPCGYSGSRFGPQVHIAAPFSAYSMAMNGTYRGYCGTSISAPLVSGVAALVWSHNPSWTAEQVGLQIENNAAAVNVLPYGLSFGRVDAGAAVYSQLPPPPPPPPVGVAITGPNQVPARHSCTWTAGAWGGTPPYSYAWTVNGSAAGNGSDTLTINTPSAGFTIAVVASDAGGQHAATSVSVSIGGTSCLAQ
jgi:serine protease